MTAIGTCPLCGKPIADGSARKPTAAGDDWSFAAVHFCAGSVEQRQADDAARAKAKAAKKGKRP